MKENKAFYLKVGVVFGLVSVLINTLSILVPFFMILTLFFGLFLSGFGFLLLALLIPLINNLTVTILLMSIGTIIFSTSYAYAYSKLKKKNHVVAILIYLAINFVSFLIGISRMHLF